MQFIYSIFGYPLGWIMWLCYQIVHNYGIAIILFTILAKAIMIPTSLKTHKNGIKMAMMRPKMEEIQKKYAGNKQKMNEEMMKLYEREHYNPMSGSCLPLLIQFPIIFGLIDVIYKPITHILRLPGDVINKAIEIAQGIAGTTNLGYTAEITVYAQMQNPDNLAKFSEIGGQYVDKIAGLNLNFLGLDLSQSPGFTLSVLMIIPILSGISALVMSIISMKTNPATLAMEGQAGSGMSKGMMYIMPLFSLFFAFSVPAGVGFYWTLTNVFSIVQSLILYKMYNPTEIVARIKAEQEAAKERERAEKIEARRLAKESGQLDPELSHKGKTPKEISRLKLAEARKRMAEKYGEEYNEDADSQD